MRAHHLTFLAAAVGCAAAATFACGSSPEANVQQITKTTQASSVAVNMFDKSGNQLGSCSGTLISPDLVLTAGHCAAGVTRWTVIAQAGDVKTSASRAVTPWKNFRSNLSHPDHSDLALLVLDSPVRIDSYPEIASSQLEDGATALRFHRENAASKDVAASSVTVKDGAPRGFRLNYATSFADGEWLDTGGALVDSATGKIHGVVSGVGKTTGLLYIARTDGFAKWIAKAATCAGSGSTLSTRTYGSPGGSSSGGSSGGYGGGSSGGGYGGGSSSGGWGGYGGGGDKIDAGTGSSSSGGSSSGGTSSGGTDGDNGGSSSGGTDSSCPPPPSCNGPDCPGGGPGGSSSGGASSSGSTGASSSGGSSSGGSSSGGSSSGGSSSGGSSGAGGSSGSSGGGSDTCQGSGDNPDVCPPDTQDCSGPSCGGCGGVNGCTDGTIDYGDCGCSGSPSTGTSPVLH